MDATPATDWEIDEVFARLDPESAREVELAGSDIAQAHQMFSCLASIRQADTIRHEGEVLAVFGWSIIDGAIETGFLAKERFFRPDIPSVRFLGRHFRALQDRSGGIPLISHSYSRRATAPRWFDLIGYDLVATDGPCRTYRLPERSAARQRQRFRHPASGPEGGGREDVGKR
ncbi:hypothetical protein C8N35_111102 [Breoghania corrubedonensis]|uniref:N-acetyltransferase domain-containing protein n=2 Tax=Breoghania corrubedonensis TaxID=665038 RepID=A0A2T5UYP9_9HYPH|nr:hypothetical protein C8N35_111102 [Breoghania corrubedonensis]